ncbi:FecR family protein [Robertkochia solimangrovi]|uniref:FecR family protein n=1 Tax=Robertkochia solimangrovi TaxID=2213046 RepID=UPI0013A52FC8|nr:FecR family protein [Robertkochia solimangrovi]
MEKLIVKFLTNAASDKELLELQQWLNQTENEKLFAKYVQLHRAINKSVLNFDSGKAKEILFQKIEAESKIYKRKLFYQTLKYAAMVVLAIGVGLFMLTKRNEVINNPANTPVIVNNQIKSGEAKAILTLSDGSQITLNKENRYTSENVNSDGEQLVYHNVDTPEEKITYNTLTIPRGGQYFVQLSDSTRVWLNAETQLKYPVSFERGVEREVELVYGEAYFEVSSSAKNAGAGFQVSHNSQKVDVLGTEFNIKAYKDESTTTTTLVEGKVRISNSQHQKKLIPGEQAILHFTTQEFLISNVNVFDAVSWKDGVFSFNHMELEEIMKVLSRWYDMEVIFENPALRKQGFTGAIGKDQNIVDLLNTLKEFNSIKNYQINDKTIILK